MGEGKNQSEIPLPRLRDRNDTGEIDTPCQLSKLRPSPPWGRGWTALAFSSAGAGRVRGSCPPHKGGAFTHSRRSSRSRPSTLHGQVVQVFVADLDALQRRDLAIILLHVEMLHAALGRCREDALPINSPLPHLGK